MHSCELLIEALNKYEGSFILVSHDRYFISKTANKIWEIDNHQIKEFKGNYEEWVAWKERKSAEKTAPSPDTRKQTAASRTPEKKEESSPAVRREAPQPSTQQKESKKEWQKLQRQFQELEEKMNRLKAKREELEVSLSLPETYSDKTKFMETEAAYKKAHEELTQVTSQYEDVFEKMIEMEEGNGVPGA
jgi:ATP-binding cassette subfamily F protein 3